VWDKAATIRFLRPGKETLHATFRVTSDEVAALRSEVDQVGRVEREYTAELMNAAGEAHARCQKLLSIRRRS
jgi:hypothetical protein